MKKITKRRIVPTTKYPQSRKLVELSEELSSINRRLKLLIPRVIALESDSRALTVSRR